MRKVKRMPGFHSLLLLLFFTTGMVQAQSPGDNKNIRSAIEEVYDGFSKHLRDGNANAIVENYYTTDAKFYPPQGGVSTGTEEIENALNGIINAGVTVELEIRELEVFGNMAYEYGVAHIFNEQGDRVDQNEYVVLWKKDRGDWKIYRDFIKAGTPNSQ
jgi:ketosteroid isomerase-like protein